LIVYSLIRYFQYLDTDCLGYLQSNYREILNRKFSIYARKKIYSDLMSQGELNEGETIDSITTFNLNQFIDSGKGYLFSSHLNFTVSNFKTRDQRKIETSGIMIKNSMVQYLKLKSVLVYVIRRPYFFELLFPIILGFVSIGFGLYDVFHIRP